VGWLIAKVRCHLAGGAEVRVDGSGNSICRARECSPEPDQSNGERIQGSVLPVAGTERRPISAVATMT